MLYVRKSEHWPATSKKKDEKGETDEGHRGDSRGGESERVKNREASALLVLGGGTCPTKK